MFPVHQVWPKPSCKAQWKGEEDKADRKRGVKTTSGNGQAWSSAGPRGQWRTGKKKRRKLVAKSSVVPQRLSRLRDWWWWWFSYYVVNHLMFVCKDIWQRIISLCFCLSVCLSPPHPLSSPREETTQNNKWCVINCFYTLSLQLYRVEKFTKACSLSW